jgi:hypothetical protein
MYCCIYVNAKSALFCLVVQWRQGLLLCLYKPYIWNAAQRPPPPHPTLWNSCQSRGIRNKYTCTIIFGKHLPEFI